MALPQKLSWDMAQSVWARSIEPVLNNPLNNVVVLSSVQLTAGNNVVNHKLGRNLQGWFITRVRAASTVYDTQDKNQTPQLTLNLNSSANVVVDIAVF